MSFIQQHAVSRTAACFSSSSARALSLFSKLLRKEPHAGYSLVNIQLLHSQHQSRPLLLCCLTVAYKGRGRSGKDKNAAVDRDRAIAVVASAAESAIRRCGGSVQVDLSSPQVHRFDNHDLSNVWETYRTLFPKDLRLSLRLCYIIRYTKQVLSHHPLPPPPFPNPRHPP